MNEQQMAQLLAFMQQQMKDSQNNMADLPQRAMQAGATPTQGSGGTILSPDPVRRVQQANEAWRERFPNVVENAARVGMTPEALLASRGNDATNQWAQLGGVPGVDPQKLRDMNRAASQYSAFAKAQREGTNGVTSEIPASEWEQGAKYRVGQSGSGSVAADGTRTITSPYGTVSMGPQNPQVAAAPAPQTSNAPTTAGIGGFDLFGPNPIRSGVQSYMENAPQAWRENVIPNAPVNTSVAPPTQGSNLRQDVIQGASFLPNMLLGAGSTIAEGVGSLFGKQFDLPAVNMQSDFFSNLKNTFGGSPDSQLTMDPNSPVGLSYQTPKPQGTQTAGQPAPANPQAPNQYSAPGMTPESRAQMPVTVGPNERNPFGSAAPAQPNFFNQTSGFSQGQTTPLTQDQTRNMFMTEEEKKKRSQQQPMMAGR
jgi:hypothetical protein